MRANSVHSELDAKIDQSCGELEARLDERTVRLESKIILQCQMMQKNILIQLGSLITVLLGLFLVRSRRSFRKHMEYVNDEKMGSFGRSFSGFFGSTSWGENSGCTNGRRATVGKKLC